jgi:sialate O-acetylesterase
MIKLLLISLFLAPVVVVAQFRLPEIFSDHMVLQRDQPIHLWGKGFPGQSVSVHCAGEWQQTTVKTDSTWSIYCTKQSARSSPQQIVLISGKDSLSLNDILIGDIWLCLGQSNMEFPMQREMHFKEELRQCDQPLIRLYNPAYTGKDWFGKPYTDSMLQRLTPGDFYKGDWRRCDSNSIKTMSAVGYYFGKDIAMRENIPIGLINLAIGGCPAETFIDPALLKTGPFAAKAKGDWLQNNSLPVWVRTRGDQNIAGNPQALRDEGGPDHPYKPGFAYSAGIKPMLPLPIRGVIWYQGESNAQEPERVDEYNDLLRLMIDGYRAAWNQPDMPFYWVQLSSIDTAHYSSRYWPEFRDDQRRLLDEVDHAGMAVCSDIGFKDNVHPTDKKDVGERLARWALNQTYGVDIRPSGPLPVSAVYRNGAMVISYRYAGGGLRTSDNGPVRGFSIDGQSDTGGGPDVAAVIRDSTVVIEAAAYAKASGDPAAAGKPDYVYYGWKPFTDANLCNSDGLPASTFKLPVEGQIKGKGPLKVEGQQPPGAVFVAGEEGYRSFRIPAIIQSGNGDLLAFGEGRVNGSADFGNVKIVLKRSRDQGRTWGALQVVASNDSLQAGNAAPVLDRTDPAWPGGRLFLFYCTGNKPEGEVRKGNGSREIWYKTSVDDGLTWSAAVNITAMVRRPGWRSYANTPGHAIQFLHGKYRGRLYVAANHSAGDPQPHFKDYRADGYYTDDHGKTFHLSDDVAIPSGNECMAAELSGDRLMLNIRNQSGQPRERIVAVSSDGGSTWDTAYFDQNLPDPVCQGSILTVGERKGRAVIAFCNDADTARRDNLTLRLSFDEGKTWTINDVVDKAPAGRNPRDYTAYSDLVQLSRKRIGVLYEKDNYKEIFFTTVKW